MALRISEAVCDANGNKRIIANGTPIPWHLLGAAQMAQVNRAIASCGDAVASDRWAADKPCRFVFDSATGSAQPDRKPPVRESDEFGDGDGWPSDGGNGEGDGDSQSQSQSQSQGQGQSQSQGDGDDRPVMHGEFDPWAAQVADDLQRIGTRGDEMYAHLGDLSERVTTVTDQTDDLQRIVKSLKARVAKLVSDGNNGGDGGVRRIIIETRAPREPQELPQDELFHAMFPRLLKNVSAGVHCYLPGPPGSGKSHSAAQVARVLDYEFGSISLGPTTPESRLWGGKDANGNFHEPTFVELARFAMSNPDRGAVFCLDEMDNGHAGIIATLNSALANGWFTAPNGDTIKWGRNFVVVAGANTFGTGPTAEFAGRNKLDAATLDRFNYLPWDTDLSMEESIVRGVLHHDQSLASDWLDAWRSARANVAAHGLKVFVTMRGAQRGAIMLAGGDTIHDAMNEVLLYKLPADQVVKVSPL